MVATAVHSLGELPQTSDVSAANREIIAAPSAALSVLLHELSRLIRLPPNWDLNEGVPVAPEAAWSSVGFLDAGLAYGLSAVLMPSSEGSLLAEWLHEHRLLQMEWFPDGTAEFTLSERHLLIASGAPPLNAAVLFATLLESPQS
jgi:hypothetical protein